MRFWGGGLGGRVSSAGVVEHVRLEASLLEVTISRQRFYQCALLHDDEGEAIRQAPVFVNTIPVEFDCGNSKLGLKRYNLDSAVGVNSMVRFCRDGPFAGIRESIEPFPEDGFGGHNLAGGSPYRLIPGDSLGMILIPSAGNSNPEGGVCEVGGRFYFSSDEARP